ncbi:uncharacterized protein LOC117781068 [Drosophila innubila]|uniref:uncharacterized protein LOC117781068 n=1 Tax=Drosophila innubila TaxID=198719 RepID=UPI00148D318F|nr:uncharacterized protein LOC117781068 [Drosophila innubila]
MYGQYSHRNILQKYKTLKTTEGGIGMKSQKTEELNQPEVKPIAEVVPDNIKISARVAPNQLTEVTMGNVSSDANNLNQIPSNHSTQYKQNNQGSGNAFGQIREQHIFFPLPKDAVILEEPRIYHSITVDLEELLSPQSFAKFLILLIYIMDCNYRKKISLSQSIRLFGKFLPSWIYYILCVNIVFIIFLVLYLVRVCIPFNKPKSESYWEGLMRQLVSMLKTMRL